MTQPTLGFTILFMLFSLVFISNSFKLWFKTDEYYEEIYNSLAREPAVIPFRDFFLERIKNKQNWLLWQKIFSLLGITAVLAADVLLLTAYLN